MFDQEVGHLKYNPQSKLKCTQMDTINDNIYQV